MLNFIKHRDHALMLRIHHWEAPDWVRLVMVTASRAGDGWLWYGLGLLILMAGDHNRVASVFAGTAATSLGLIIYAIAKKITRRPRPCLVEKNLWADMLPPDQYSFPSGHTIAGFAITLSVGQFYPPLFMPLLLTALLIATSRIMLGMHYLSDVVAGMALGATLGHFAFHLIS
jgi:undecaprenyl-diphosphatase